MKKRRNIGCKGISPIIASLFMILLVIFLAIIIFSWSRGFLNERIEKFGNPIENACSSVDLGIDVVDNGGGYQLLEVLNRGDIGVSSLAIKMYFGGYSDVVVLDVLLFPGESSVKEVSLKVGNDGSVVENIEIFPVLSGVVVGENDITTATCYDYPISVDFD